MKIRSALVLGFASLHSSTAFAQDDHKLEVTVDYSYVHANPQNNDVIPTFSLNGGGGGFAYYLTRNIGIQAEFQGYGSYTHPSAVPSPRVTTTRATSGTRPESSSASDKTFTAQSGSGEIRVQRS
jgi:hypothetical protein